jgi:peptidoglycan/xylan/chitin deacetylase (PgdA/CDA1 family)
MLACELETTVRVAAARKGCWVAPLTGGSHLADLYHPAALPIPHGQHDDAITSRTYDAMRSVTDDVDANGCPATATMFVTSTGTDCELLVDLYRSGYEIGDHTISHKSFLTQSYSQLENEILGARERIAACGIPESAIQGLRAPFLEIKGDVWEILADNGFLYDRWEQ